MLRSLFVLMATSSVSFVPRQLVPRWPDRSVVERMESYITRREDGCWQWLGGVSGHGYGRFYADGRQQQAHRVMWEARVGPIPPGLELDHLCRNPGCVNPDHLEPVTPKENKLRGVSPLALKAQQTHCYRGHPFTPDNTRLRVRGRGFSRICKTCAYEYQRDYKARVRV